MPRSGEQVRGWRARESLERGRASPEGASSPRARRNFTRGGVQPSSGAEPYSRGRPTLERGGTSPEGASIPRARRSLVSAVLCPSSKAEFRPRVAGVDRSGGPPGPPGPWAPAAGPWSFSGVFYSCTFVCVLFFRKKVGFSRLSRGPLWLSPTTMVHILIFHCLCR
jgi:hypothetical protein